MKSRKAFRAVVSHKFDVSFVYERCGLKGVVLTFAPQTIRSASPQLFIHQRHQPGWRLRIAVVPLAENLGDVGHFRGDHAVLLSIRKFRIRVSDYGTLLRNS